MYADLVEYKAPEWIERAIESEVLKREAVPTHRYHLMAGIENSLGRAITPIHRWNNFFPEQHGYEIFLKRDDLTGCELSGSKIRKLEFLLADAKMRQANVIATLGPMQSNHCRATAIASKLLGFDAEMFLMPIEDPRQVYWDNDVISRKSGNLFLDRLVGAKIHRLKTKDPKKALRELEDAVDQMKLEGKNPYLIPAGGSNEIGLWGYLECLQEMLEYQDLENRFDDIVVATGSGGTIAGLALGLFLSGCKKIRLHAFAVNGSSESLYQHIDNLFQRISQKKTPHDTNIKLPKAKDLVHIMDRYKGRGYGMVTQEELKFTKSIASKSGILLDPVYTAKAAFALWQELTIDSKEPQPDRKMFRGKRILFIHTGGVFSWFDDCIQGDFNRTFPVKDIEREE